MSVEWDEKIVGRVTAIEIEKETGRVMATVQFDSEVRNQGATRYEIKRRITELTHYVRELKHSVREQKAYIKRCHKEMRPSKRDQTARRRRKNRHRCRAKRTERQKQWHARLRQFEYLLTPPCEGAVFLG